MSLVVIRNIVTGAGRIVDVRPGDAVGHTADEYVVNPREEAGEARANHDALFLREVEALEKLADRAKTRNQLHAESIALQTAHDARSQEVLEITRQEQEQRDRVAEHLMAPSPLMARPDTQGVLMGASPLENFVPPSEDDVQSAAEPERQVYAILRDPSTAPAGWVNTVKRTYDLYSDALREAMRLSGKHGGRFLVLQTTSYAEATPRIWSGVPDPAADLADLPF